jgi:hypothetical protein
MSINEIFTKATQTANLLVRDLVEAYHEASAACQQAGVTTLRDKALMAYLGDRLVAARKLERDLLDLR